MGFCSQITAGSSLPFKVPIMRETVVEVIAQRGFVRFLICNPEDAIEMHWMNGQPKHRPYR